MVDLTGRRRTRAIRAAALVLILVLVAPLASPVVRNNIEMGVLAFRCRDPNFRLGKERRLELLRRGRPWIDSMYPQIVSEEIEDNPGIVFVGRVVHRDKTADVPFTHYKIEDDFGIPFPTTGPTDFYSFDRDVSHVAALTRTENAEHELVVRSIHRGDG